MLPLWGFLLSIQQALNSPFDTMYQCLVQRFFSVVRKMLANIFYLLLHVFKCNTEVNMSWSHLTKFRFNFHFHCRALLTTRYWTAPASTSLYGDADTQSWKLANENNREQYAYWRLLPSLMNQAFMKCQQGA